MAASRPRCAAAPRCPQSFFSMVLGPGDSFGWEIDCEFKRQRCVVAVSQLDVMELPRAWIGTWGTQTGARGGGAAGRRGGGAGTLGRLPSARPVLPPRVHVWCRACRGYALTCSPAA